MNSRKSSGKTRGGFTLIELLVVIGIISVLIGASVGGYNAVVKSAQRARGQELVTQAATALEKVLQSSGSWPATIVSEGGGGSGQFTPEVGAALARRGALSLTYKQNKDESTGRTRYVLSGVDRFGVVSPWAQDVIKRRGSSVTLGTKVPSGGTIQDHRLRFAIDADMEKGTVTANVDGYGSVTIRGSVAVWCCGSDGKFGTKDDIRSWAKEQEIR